MTPMERLRRHILRIGRRAIIAASIATALGGSPAGTPTFAVDVPGRSPGQAAATGVWCSTLGRRVSTSGGAPVELTAGVGSRQATAVGARFPIPLAITATNADGHPAPDALITFSAPRTGASGRFMVRSHSPHHRPHVSHLRTLTIETNACGIAVAPAFTANNTQGGYIVEATAKHTRPAAFALVNEAPGQSS